MSVDQRMVGRDLKDQIFCVFSESPPRAVPELTEGCLETEEFAWVFTKPARHGKGTLKDRPKIAFGEL